MLRPLSIPNTHVYPFTISPNARHTLPRRMAANMVNSPTPPTASTPPTNPTAAAKNHTPPRDGSPPRKRSKRNVEGFETVATASAVTDQRLDQCLQHVMAAHFSTSSAAKKAIRRMEVVVNGDRVHKTDLMVHAGDVIEWQQRRGPKKQPAWRTMRQDANIVVVYEDGHFACVIKPPGWATRGTPHKRKGPKLCVDDMLHFACEPTTELGAYPQARPVHRLDAPTGGLLLVAKTAHGMRTLAYDFAERRVYKRYQAVVHGQLEGHGMIDAPLKERHAVTYYRAVNSVTHEDGQVVTVVDLWPKTGRTHQLRKHMALIGHPLVGDKRYTAGFASLKPDRAVDHQRGVALDVAHDQQQAVLPSKPTVTESNTHTRAVPAGCTSLDRSFCLWAVELFVQHPVTREWLRLALTDVPLRTSIVVGDASGGESELEEDDGAEA